MSDYTELKALAQAVSGLNKESSYPWEQTISDGRLGKTSTAYALAANPAAILSLIAEVDGLKKVSEKLNRERLAAERRYEEQAAARGKLAEEYGRLNYCANICLDERDQLKSELEALRKATGPDYLLRASH